MTRAKKGTSRSARLASQLFIKPKPVKAVAAPEPPAFDSLSVDRKQCNKAIQALVAFVKRKIAEKEETDLLAGEENEVVWLAVSLKRMSPKDTHKPIRIPLPNPLLDPRQNPVCLLVKDPQREYKDLLEAKMIKFISRVVGMEKLQGKFKPFEARRQLMKEHDLFLVDDRIVPEMPRVLGKSWLQAKKSPIPVTLKRADLKAELERAISSTYMRINKGTALSIKLGSLARHTPEQLLQNLLSVIPYLAVRVPLGGWDNVQALHIKTTTSVSLPLWNCSLALDEGDTKAGRFFAPLSNEEEIAARRSLKDEKDKRIKEKERKKQASADKTAEASSSAQSASDEIEIEDSMVPLEEIDDTTSDANLPSQGAKGKRTKPKKPKKPSASPTGAERKKVSTTSAKVKGMDAIKGLPRKPKGKA